MDEVADKLAKDDDVTADSNDYKPPNDSAKDLKEEGAEMTYLDQVLIRRQWRKWDSSEQICQMCTREQQSNSLFTS